jgi:hypothetical protein
LSGPSLDLIALIRPLQLCDDGGYQLRLGVLGVPLIMVLDRWSPKTVTTSSMVGRSKPGCGLCPSLSFKDFHHQCWGGECAEWVVASAWVGNPFLPLAFGGERHPPAPRRLPSAMPGKADCCCPARVQHSVLRPGDGRAAYGPATSRSSSRRQPRQRVAQHVARHEGDAHVLGWPRRGRERGPAGALWGAWRPLVRC